MKRRGIVDCISGILLMAFCVGCQSGPAIKPVYYTLAYPVPQALLQSRIDAVLRLEPVAVSAEVVGRDMVYQDGPYQRSVYHYSRWIQFPAEMVQELLLRDMRGSGLFRAVLSAEEAGVTPYVLNTRLDSFRLGEGQKNQSQAVLTVSVTMADSRFQKGRTEGIVLQKTYDITEPLESRGPEALAKGMSAAMARFSTEMLRDVAEAMKKSDK